MGDIKLAAPPLTYVSWGCRRCGFAGGTARTTFPVERNWSEEMGRALFTTLREKLVRVHQAKHGCVAALDDFIIGKYAPVTQAGQAKQVVGLIE